MDQYQCAHAWQGVTIVGCYGATDAAEYWVI